LTQTAADATTLDTQRLSPQRPHYLTVAELATALGQSERTTRQLLNHGLIPGARRMDPHAGPSQAPAGRDRDGLATEQHRGGKRRTRHARNPREGRGAR